MRLRRAWGAPLLRRPCADVAAQDLRYTQPLQRLGDQIVVVPHSATHHVYLIRTAGGCVSVMKEMIYS
ncbi:hypothetical protein [Variovorax ginsengisoli]|uniref:Uncharacterized protein n=1 Tax=Variovorax ginsengisoli TaxID=363844 RepID=A0ABT9S815_9BURK|nr:hypothetical protein [Variovorax ginsengisoli]MDP9899512.1 hypothetical protein [Variovorax ginsengisoli]